MDVFARQFVASHFRTGILAIACCLWPGMAAIRGNAQTFTNPILSDGADPWIIYHEGRYYLTFTTGSNVQIRHATQLAGTNGIGRAPVTTAFYPPAPFNRNVWAPELHFLRGKAYLYYAADDGNNANHRLFAAESDSAGPTFSFVWKGKVFDSTTDRWAIDGTIFEADDGSLYCIWAGWPGTVDGLQNLYIASMSDPLNINGPRVLLASPTLPWESWIEEGPEVLKRGSHGFLVCAANLSWTDNECLGMLVNTNGHYLDPASWTKVSTPVFATTVSSNGSVYGPGHCSFTKSLDGTEDWLFYHAAKYSGAGWNRSIRMQSFSWSTNGYPDFGAPVPVGVPLAIPSGDAYTAARFETVSPQRDGMV